MLLEHSLARARGGLGGRAGGGAPHHVRALAEALGRQLEASRYSPDISKHYAIGDDPSLKQVNRDFRDRL